MALLARRLAAKNHASGNRNSVDLRHEPPHPRAQPFIGSSQLWLAKVKRCRASVVSSKCSIGTEAFFGGSVKVHCWKLLFMCSGSPSRLRRLFASRAADELMKVIPIIAAILGLAMIGALVGYFGAGAVVRSLRAIGWAGFSAICVIHLAVISLEGIAWRLLVPGAQAWAFVWGRLIRDAGSEVLPVSQMGGCVLGARAVALAGVPGSVAAATTMVDLTLEFVAKLAYMAIGLILLIHLRPGMPVSLPVTFGLAATGLFALAFVIVQRHGFAFFDRIALTLGRGWAERTASGVAAV